MKFIQHIFWILVPAAAIALTGCSNGEYVLGGQYLDSHMQSVIIDTCTVRLSTVELDSVKTSNSGRGIVGRYISDKYFGEVKATTYLTYAKPNGQKIENVNSNKLQYDSCVMVMTLTGAYLGDTLKTHDFNLNMLKEAIEPPGTDEFFWSNETREYNSTPFLTYTLHPRPNTIFKDKPSFPYYNLTNHFYMRLPDTLGIGLFNKLLDNGSTSIVNNDNKWREYFPGIAITAGDNNDAIFGFKVNSDSLGTIRVYYHYTESRRIKGHFDIKVDPTRYFYGVECDRKTGLPFSNLRTGNESPITGKKEIPAKNSGNVAMVQALTATYVKIEFPYLNNLLELGDFCAITDAALMLYPVERSYSDTMPLPGSLSLYYSDEHDAAIAQVTSSTGTALTGNLIKDEYKKNTYYSYDISSFLNSQLGKTGMYKRYLQLTPASDTLTSSVSTMILADPKLRSNATRVIIKFLVYENE